MLFNNYYVWNEQVYKCCVFQYPTVLIYLCWIKTVLKALLLESKEMCFFFLTNVDNRIMYYIMCFIYFLKSYPWKSNIFYMSHVNFYTRYTCKGLCNEWFIWTCYIIKLCLNCYLCWLRVPWIHSCRLRSYLAHGETSWITAAIIQELKHLVLIHIFIK